jgi:hypothetical protein
LTWQRRFDHPIRALPGRRDLVTLRDAGSYIAALPRAKQDRPEWQTAAEALIMAAERSGGPLMHARIGMLLALNHGESDPKIAPPRKRCSGMGHVAD